MRIIQSYDKRPLNLLAISSEGLIAAASDTFGVVGDVEVWDAATGARRFVRTAPHHSVTGAVAFTPDGRYLLAGDPQFAVTDVNTAKEVARVPIKFSNPGFALSADGSRLIVSSSWNQCGAVECFAVEAGWTFRQLWIEGPPSEMCWFDAVAISPDGALVSVVERSPFGGTGGRPALDVSVRDTDTGKVRFTHTTDAASPVQQLAFTADGTQLLVRTEGRTVQVFDAQSGVPAGELVHPRRPYVTGMAVHPGELVACVRTDGTVTFWDAKKRELLRTLDWKAGKLVSVAFAPDGALAAAGTEDGKVVVWDVDL